MPYIEFRDFVDIFPNCPDPKLWSSQLNQLFADTKSPSFSQTDAVMFCAQLGHESGGFRVFKENLNYQSTALLRVFPRYFTTNTAAAYHRKPEQIANVVYANRMGNGDVSSGDGWKYSGTGPIQITGKHNYRACSKYLFDNESILLDDPSLLLEPRYGLAQSLWFWDTNNLFGVTDIRRATRIINGGFNGLDHRQSLFDELSKIMS